jgi:hypothetical protein
MKQEKIDAFELLAVHMGVGRQLQHPIQADWRMIRVWFLTNETRPHRIMKLGKSIGHFALVLEE